MINLREPRGAMARKLHRPAFTLIELLVVIAIIGLLISILLPALQRARRQSRGLVCMTHLRELSNGWNMYADDFNDVAVPGRLFDAGGGAGNPENWYDVGNGLKYRPRWVAMMGKYVGAFAFNTPLLADKQDYDNPVYQCPEAPDWMDERNHAYGYNHQFLGNGRQTVGRFHNFPVLRSRINAVSGTVLAIDTMGTAAGFAGIDRSGYENNGSNMFALGNHGYTLDPPRLTAESDRGTGDPGTTRTAPDPRHDGKAATLFCDGHTSRETLVDLGYRLLPSGQIVDLEVIPNPPHNRLFSGTGRDLDPPPIPTSAD